MLTCSGSSFLGFSSFFSPNFPIFLWLNFDSHRGEVNLQDVGTDQSPFAMCFDLLNPTNDA
jgi:hypothetical protein